MPGLFCRFKTRNNIGFVDKQNGARIRVGPEPDRLLRLIKSAKVLNLDKKAYIQQYRSAEKLFYNNRFSDRRALHTNEPCIYNYRLHRLARCSGRGAVSKILFLRQKFVARALPQAL